MFREIRKKKNQMLSSGKNVQIFEIDIEHFSGKEVQEC